MKILYIASPSIHMTRWVGYFSSRGHDVHLITSSPCSPMENVTIHHIHRFQLPSKVANYAWNAGPMWAQFYAILQKVKPNIVHAHQVMELSLLGAGFHPFVVTPWGSDVLINPNESAIAKQVVKRVLSSADLITCDAEHIKNPMVKLGADPRKIHLICFGTDTEKYHPCQRDNELSQQWGGKVVISLRNFEPVYDVETLIRAIPIVRVTHKNVLFILAGKGSHEEYLKSLTIQLGVSDAVKFVGFVPQGIMPSYLASADVYVSTSLSDAGLSASTAEAMSSGLPCVITDFGDNSKWIQNGVSGYLFPPKDFGALADRISLLLSNHERNLLGLMGRKTIMERNSWQNEMQKMERLYEGLVK